MLLTPQALIAEIKTNGWKMICCSGFIGIPEKLLKCYRSIMTTRFEREYSPRVLNRWQHTNALVTRFRSATDLPAGQCAGGIERDRMYMAG